VVSRRVIRDGRGSGAEECVDYARSYVRGFVTTYMAWFLGLDAEDGFWSDYFWPLERLWSINRAQKDVSIMRGKGLVDVNRLRLTERGWGCMEHALVEFLKHEFNGVNIVKEYPQVVLIAPGFTYENGIDVLDIKPIEKVDEYIFMIKKLSEVSESNRNDPKFMRTRIAIGYAVRALVNKRKYSDEVETLPSRWLIPIIPYLINMGFRCNFNSELGQERDTSVQKVTLTLTAENIHLVLILSKNYLTF
jgi:hypothetical protein